VAVEWFRKAADQGYPQGQFGLGWMYANGRGVPKDENEAVQWYRKAAEQGYDFAQTNLGAMYADGRGVAKDDVEAVKWYRKAADHGDALAQRLLGNMYLQGRGGLPKDDEQAAEWYRLAADRGDAVARSNLIALKGAGRSIATIDASGIAIELLEHERQRLYIALIREHKNVRLIVNGNTVTQDNVAAFSDQNERELQALSDESKRRGFVMVAGEYNLQPAVVQENEKIPPCATPQAVAGSVTVVQEGSTIEFRDVAGKISGYGVVVQSTVGVVPGPRDQTAPLVLLGTITGDEVSLVLRDRTPLALNPNAAPLICRIGVLSKAGGKQEQVGR
jgi:hypothetical protein